MNNLEKLKELNPNFYEKIKLKYVTNAQNVKILLDNITIDYYKKDIESLSSVEELKNLKLKSSTMDYVHERMNAQMKEAEKLIKQTQEAEKKILEILSKRELDINDIIDKIESLEK